MSVAIIGATSGIAMAIAERFAQARHDLLLVARRVDALEPLCAKLGSADMQVSTATCDVLDQGAHAALASQVINHFDDDPYVVLAVGSIDGQQNAPVDPDAALRLIDINFRNLVSILTPIAEALAQRGHGTIIVISSVAGDRGRQSNYLYGAAKAGLTTYAQGLRNRLAAKGVHVSTVKPGYVDTPMLRESLGDEFDSTPGMLVGRPTRVADTIYRAALKKRDVIYVDGIWRWIMLVIRLIPERLFKRLDL